MENVTKSIIYGNSYQNRYGKFLPVCSSISQRLSMHSILEYLHDTFHFKKYNRIAYAYRVQETPIIFITQKKNADSQHYEGCHSDETIQGSGQKLLYLLEKFNIRNVFIGIMIQQFNPLLPFETTNYRAIVQNCRLLLDDLYKKVVALQDKAEIKSFNDLILHNNHTAKVKKCNISDTIQFPNKIEKKSAVKDRPNHIYSNGKPQFLSSVQKKSDPSFTYEIKFLWDRCKLMKQQFQSLLKSLDEKQIEQLKYYSMYDKNLAINQILKLFTIYQNIDKHFLLHEYNFNAIKQMKFQVIDQKILKKLEDLLKSNKKLSVDVILKTNRPVGILFCLIQLKIRFTKTLKRIGQLMEKSTLNEKQLLQINKARKNSQESHHQDQVTPSSKTRFKFSITMGSDIKINKF